MISFVEEVSQMSKSGYSDIELLEYIDEHFDETECELNGELKSIRNPNTIVIFALTAKW